MIRVYDRFEAIENGQCVHYKSAKEWLDSLTQYDPEHPFSYAYHELNGSHEKRTLLISRKPHYHDFVRRYAYVRGDDDDINEISTLLPKWSPSLARQYSVLQEHFSNVELALQALSTAIVHASSIDAGHVELVLRYAGKATIDLGHIWKEILKERDVFYKASLPFPMNVFPKRLPKADDADDTDDELHRT